MKAKTTIHAVLVTSLLLGLVLTQSQASPRIKDICSLSGMGQTKLIGYGLVVGLEGTGDSKGTEFTIQTVVNMLQRMGITVPKQKVRTKNVAAVIVSAELPATAVVRRKAELPDKKPASAQLSLF